MFSRLHRKNAVHVKKPKKGKRLITLHSAAKFGNHEKLSQLIRKGADINAINHSGDTALHIAVENADTNCAKLLILEGADVNIKCRDGFTALHVAAALNLDDIIILLISKGAAVDACGHDDITPLHYAISQSSVECAKLLLKHGACVNAALNSGRTPLHIAVSKSEDCIDLLIAENADIFARDILSVTPLEMAAELGVNILKQILPDKPTVSNEDGTTPLHIASRGVSAESVKFLIGMGYDVNAQNDLGDSPLHFACMMGLTFNDGMQARIQFACAENIELLIKAGADIHRRNKDGLAPIHVSAKFDHLLSLMYLHQFGSDLNLCGGKDDYMPLHFAAEAGSEECINFLIQKGADKTAVNAVGSTALMLAAKNSRFSCVKILLELDVPLWATEENMK